MVVQCCLPSSRTQRLEPILECQGLALEPSLNVILKALDAVVFGTRPEKQKELPYGCIVGHTRVGWYHVWSTSLTKGHPFDPAMPPE